MDKTQIKLIETKKCCLLWLWVVLLGAALLCLSCGGAGSSGSSSPNAPDPPSTATPLSATDVSNVVQNAVVSVNAPMVVAVADRVGNILAVFKTPGAPMTSIGNFGQTVPADELAVALARTAAFFSNNQAPISSRTVRFISGIHFPPGVAGAPNADLYGIENTNRGCTLSTHFLPGQRLSPARSIDGSHPGLGVITGKADTNDSNPLAVNPGGVPLFNGGSWRRWRSEHIAGDCRIRSVFRCEEFWISSHPSSASAARSSNNRRCCIAFCRPDNAARRNICRHFNWHIHCCPDCGHAALGRIFDWSECWQHTVTK